MRTTEKMHHMLTLAKPGSYPMKSSSTQTQVSCAAHESLIKIIQFSHLFLLFGEKRTETDMIDAFYVHFLLFVIFTSLLIRWRNRSIRPLCQETSSGDFPTEGEEEKRFGSSHVWQEFCGRREENPQAKSGLTLDFVWCIFFYSNIHPHLKSGLLCIN